MQYYPRLLILTLGLINTVHSNSCLAQTTLKIVAGDYPPYITSDRQGTITGGLLVDIAKEAFAIIHGININWHPTRRQCY